MRMNGVACSVQHLPRRHVYVQVPILFFQIHYCLSSQLKEESIHSILYLPTYSQLIGFPSSKFNVLSCKTNVFHIVFFQTKIRAFLLFCGFLDKMTGMRLKKYVAIVIINFKKQTWGKRNGRLENSWKIFSVKLKKKIYSVSFCGLNHVPSQLRLNSQNRSLSKTTTYCHMTFPK